MSSKPSLIEPFETMVGYSAKDGKVFPYPCHWVNENGGMYVEALALDVDQTYLHVLKRVMMGDEDGKEVCQELIFGIDRYAKEGQQTEFNDLVTVLHYKRIEPFDIMNPYAWRSGIIEYTTEVVRPIQWDHPYWTPILMGEIIHFLEKANSVYKVLRKKAESRIDPKKDMPELSPEELARFEELYLKYNGSDDEIQRQVMYAGWWLDSKLRSEFTAEQIEDACGVAGQRAYAVGPWTAARRVLVDVKSGIIEKPGAALAKVIMEEMVAAGGRPW